MRVGKWSVWSLVLILALGFVGALQAADAPVLSRMLDKKELRVGVSGSQPPMSAMSRSGELIGLEVDLAHLLANAFGVELKLVAKPFPELLGALEAGEFDMVMSSMAITPERTLKATFIGPYMLSGKSILTSNSALAAVKSAGELNQADLKLAALENSTSQKFVEMALPKTQLVKVQNYDEAVKMIIDGSISALVADMPICVLSVMRYPDAGLVTLSEPISLEPVGIAVPAGDAQFANLVDNYLDTFEAAGLLEALRKKWLEDGSWIAALP